MRWDAVEASVVDDEGERAEVRAEDPEEAAEAYAHDYWQDEPPDSGDTLDVVVFTDTGRQRFRVTADWSLDVDARRLP